MPTSFAVILALLNLIGVVIVGLIVSALTGFLLGACLGSPPSLNSLGKDLLFALVGLTAGLLLGIAHDILRRVYEFYPSWMIIGGVVATVSVRSWPAFFRQ